VDRSRTSPRTYCYECSPLPGTASRESRQPRRSDLPGEPFTVEHFRAWTGLLRLKDGSAFVLEPWEERFVADVFAGFKECWLIVPEGNGKSTLIAVLILYCVEFADEAAIPVAASARDQAKIIYDQGSGFVRRSPALRGRFDYKPGLREIVFGEASRAKIFASDADVADGIIPWPLEVLDELHRHKSLDLYRTWAGKLDKEDSQLVVISTAGAPGSEFEALREQMRQSATSVERDGCFGRYVGEASVLHEYAIPEGGDVDDLELVKEANPSSRITVETLRAKRSRPSFSLPHWRRLTCNLPTRSDSAAVTEREWADALAEERIAEGTPVWAGLDLGFRYDATALVPLWWRDDEFRLFGSATVLPPPQEGSLHPDAVKRALLELHERTPIETLVMDPTRGEDIASWVEDELGCRVVERGQSLSFQVLDYERFMEALRNGWLRHTGCERLSRHVLNAVARELPRGDIVFERPHKSRFGNQTLRAVDALDAAAMVHTTAVAEFTGEPEQATSWRPL
jgi:phage terminase large subunit-like protein